MGTYITISDVEAFLGQTFTGTSVPNTTQVNTWISWSSDEVDSITNQTWGTVSVVEEEVDFTRLESFQSSQTGYANGDILPKGVSFGRNDLVEHSYNSFRTAKKPIVSVGTMIANQGLPTSDYDLPLVEDDDYIVYNDIGKIVLIKNIPSLGLKRFKITYVAGNTPIPNTVKRLTTLLVSKQILNSKASANAYDDSGSISVGPISISESTGRNTVFLNNIQEEIDRLSKEVGVLDVELI